MTFTATAMDNCAPNPAITCAPPSGSTFPPGTNIVNCTATDLGANSNSCAFKVVVRDPVVVHLTIMRSDNNVVISWPQTSTRYVLEETMSLDEPIAWSPTPGTVETAGFDFQMTIPIGRGIKFFHLRSR